MKRIRPPFPAVQAIIGSQKNTETPLRTSTLCFRVPCQDGVLLYHTLTGELLLLSTQEAVEAESDKNLRGELAKRWFLVPKGFDENKHCDQVKAVVRALKPPCKDLKTAVIFTTSDCNARCFYCFEMGQSRVAMSEQTAQDTADYLIANCVGKKLEIRWFGGEPLYNAGVIDLISERLRESGIDYCSHMVSNGYYLSDEIIIKAKKLWNLRYVLVTLDGTEEIYNKTKAYINKDGSAYQRVMTNIENALRAGIHITINLNMDARNAADLMRLADELAARFGTYSGLAVRTGLLREYVGTIHNFPNVSSALKAQQELNDKLDRLGIAEKPLLDQGVMLENCMADNDSYITVLPDGRIGKCEHFIDKMEIGSIYTPERDQKLIAAWKESYPPEDRCKTCADYPICKRLKLCNGQEEACSELYQGIRLMLLRSQILNTYARVKEDRKT